MPGSALCSVSGRRCLVIDMFLRRAVIVVGGSAAALFASVAVGKRDNDPVLPWTPIPTGSWNSNWDCREPMSLINLCELNEHELESQLQKYKAKAARHIFLIRHGKYHRHANSKNYRSLTTRGREQADLTGKRLKLLDLKYNSIVHSSLPRATETAEIIKQYFPDVKITSSRVLEEGHPIQPVPASPKWRPEFKYFEKGPAIEAAFRECIHRADPEQTKDSYEIIVCHANVIRYFVCRAVITVGGSAAALFASVAVGKRDNDPDLPWTPIPTGSWNSNWDCREPASLIDPSKQKDLNEWESLLQKHTAKADRHIFLIRHGQYNKADHDHDRTLTEKGREQAKLTGKRLKSLDLQFKSIVYSSLTRTTETAEIISRRLPDVGNTPSSLLHEGHPIRPVPECEWQPEHYYFQAGPRIEAAFRKYIHRAEPEQTKDSYEIIVCHDNVIRYFVCRTSCFSGDHRFSVMPHGVSVFTQNYKRKSCRDPHPRPLVIDNCCLNVLTQQS
uniref:Serine/threonine-protein phosphatase PGAM5, mitochondrial n=1 Tax=Leptobrachium leishanense TaxID=445787 RepID=A0A8C5P9K7_9ANUR